jgi:hypothetical protein
MPDVKIHFKAIYQRHSMYSHSPSPLQRDWSVLRQIFLDLSKIQALLLWHFDPFILTASVSTYQAILLPTFVSSLSTGEGCIAVVLPVMAFESLDILLRHKQSYLYMIMGNSLRPVLHRQNTKPTEPKTLTSSANRLLNLVAIAAFPEVNQLLGNSWGNG